MIADEGFRSDRFGICVICARPYSEGDHIATAPDEHWKTSRNGATIRFGHIRCVAKARDKQNNDVQCSVCGHLVATVDLLIRATGNVELSICPQCLYSALADMDDVELRKHHFDAFGEPRRYRE